MEMVVEEVEVQTGMGTGEVSDIRETGIHEIDGEECMEMKCHLESREGLGIEVKEILNCTCLLISNILFFNMGVNSSSVLLLFYSRNNCCFNNILLNKE